MKLWFDEDLSVTLPKIAQEFGFEATCNRDRDFLGRKDPEIARTVTDESYVFVTDNRADFRKLYDVPDGIHSGLIFISGTGSRELQQRARVALRWIVDEAVQRETAPADLMVNRLLEFEEDDTAHFEWLPPL